MTQLRACLAVNGALLLAVLCGFAPPVHSQGATPPPGKALVFIFRSDREPVTTPVPVTVNAKDIGALKNGTYLTVIVAPGRTFLRTGDRVLTTFRLDAERDRTYFVRVEIVHGTTQLQTEMRLVSEAEGRRLLAQGGVATPPLAAKPPPGAVPAATAPPRAAAAAPAMTAAAPPPAAPPRPKPTAKPAPAAEAASAGGWEIALIPKVGTFKMSNGTQVVAGTTSNYDTSSKSVFGIELEWRSKSGLALGGEIFSYKNELIPSGTTSAEQQVLVATLNGKYYFSTGRGLLPFAGGGVGYSGVTYSGSLTGGAGGLALQGMAGLEYRFEHVGINLEYKYLSSTVGSSEKVKVGGSGILAGVSIIF
ncbi:MAG TPA: outer membrane beta-barrel protein [Burkholderiales bacterium]